MTQRDFQQEGRHRVGACVLILVAPPRDAPILALLIGGGRVVSRGGSGDRQVEGEGGRETGAEREVGRPRVKADVPRERGKHL